MATTVSRSTTGPTLQQLFRSRNASSYRSAAPVMCALKTTSWEGGRTSVSGNGSSQNDESYDHGQSVLRKPVVAVINGQSCGSGEYNDKAGLADEKDSSAGQWENWEDRILEEAVPLVGFVRTVLHSGKYKIWDRLKPEHQNIICERLLPYHPAYEEKIGCGVESIKIGFHPEFKGSRCLFIVRKDGESIDFSYWKCIKGLIRKKYPLFADAFILRHFRRRKRDTKI